MFRKAALVCLVLGALIVAFPSSADDHTETGVIVYGKGACDDCNGPTAHLSIQYYTLPEDHDYTLSYTPTRDGNQLHTQLRPGQWNNPDLVAVYGSDGTLAQPFQLTFTPR